MIYLDCWDEISAGNCVYSGHKLIGDELRVFVERGLDVWSERLKNHKQVDGKLRIEKCVLIFKEVLEYEWRETPFTKLPTGQVVWEDAVIERFGEGDFSNGSQYFLDGTMLDDSKSVWVEICARSFAIDVV